MSLLNKPDVILYLYTNKFVTHSIVINIFRIYFDIEVM